MITSIDEFKKLPEPAQHFLTTLRGIRDANAESLVWEITEFMSEQTAKAEMEEFLTYQGRYHALRQGLMNRLSSSAVERIDLVWLVVKRIARKEREAFGYYIEADLKNA